MCVKKESKESKDLHLFLALLLYRARSHFDRIVIVELFYYYHLDAGNYNKNHSTYVTSLWFNYIFNKVSDVKNRSIQKKQKLD